MDNPFDNDEFQLDDEWVELCDVEGHRASFRHLATVGCENKTYMILGSMQEGQEEPGALMLVREDETVDGATEYSVVNDRQEIELVIGRFVMRVLSMHMEEERIGIDDAEPACGCRHRPGDFCYCDDPAYLQ